MKKKIEGKSTNKRNWFDIVFCVTMILAVIALLLAIVIEFVGYKPVRSGFVLPEYENGTPGYEPERDLETDSNRLNLPVLPDYVISKEKPDILIPYPVQNIYDVEFSFVDIKTGELLYRTNRIVPGLSVVVPAYDFIKESGNYRVDVTTFDHDTYREIGTVAALEANIKKK